MSSESIANPSKTVSMDNGSGSGESLGHIVEKDVSE